nr:MAG TPA: hypothetical protein [Caudoviricetes sp.]
MEIFYFEMLMFRLPKHNNFKKFFFLTGCPLDQNAL